MVFTILKDEVILVYLVVVVRSPYQPLPLFPTTTYHQMTTSHKWKTQKHELEGIVQQLPKGLVFFRFCLKLFVVSDMIL